MHDHGERQPVLGVVFYRTSAGSEPVREWLLALAREDRRIIGNDIKTAQYGWPLGMPLIRKLEPGLWEARSHVANGIARVIFHGGWWLSHGPVARFPEEIAKDLSS